MPFELPNSLGPFSIDGQGRIAPRAGVEMPHFLFHWRERKISARLARQHDHEDPDRGRLMLSAWLGRVPSSADPAPAERRVASFGTLRELLEILPGDWRVRLLPDHQVRLDAEMALSWPASAVELMAELTRFLLALAPYLDLLDEEGVLEPASAGLASAGLASAGTART